MNSRTLLRHALAGLTTLAVGACDYSTSPEEQPPIDLALDFCADATPVWFAYQNLGSPDWTRVVDDGAGTFRFTANARVAIAYVFQNGSDYQTVIIGALNTELAEISGITCVEESGTKQLHGSVTGITGSTALVNMMFGSVFLQSPQTSFTLSNLPQGALDLVASRVNITGTTVQASDRIIIRKNLDLVTGTPMPVLDFGSAEAVTPTVNTVSVTGVAAEEATLFNNFFSERGTSHLLFFVQLSGDGDVFVPSVPSSITTAGDFHDMFVIANASDGSSFRGVETYFRNPANKTLPLGSALSGSPAFTEVATTPYLRHRVQLSMSGNQEYNAAVSFLMQQEFQQFSVTEVVLTVTIGYYNGSGTWDLTVPDFSAVSGWQNAWGLQSGTPLSWTATAYAGRPSLLLGATPDENEAILFAGRSSSAQALRAAPALREALRQASPIQSLRRLSPPRGGL